MKMIKKMLILIVIVVLQFTVKVNAVSGIINLDGSEDIKDTEEGIVIVTLISDNFRALEGKVETSSNITIKSIENIDNDWTVNYNNSNKNFNLYGGTGTSLMKIKYSGTAGEGYIKLTAMKMSNNAYKTETVDEITKPITVSGETQPEEPGNTTEEENTTEEPNTTEEENIIEEPNTIEEENTTEEPSTTDDKKVEKKETKQTKKSTAATKILAYTGLGKGIIVFAVVLSAIGIVGLYKYKVYKDI